MTTIYVRHDVTTIAEVNALALTDNQENGAFVLGPHGECCTWSLPYRLRNEPNETGHWSYQDGYGGDHLRDGDKATVLAPIEAEECHSEDYGSYHLMEAVDGPKPFTAYLVDQEEA